MYISVCRSWAIVISIYIYEYMYIRFYTACIYIRDVVDMESYVRCCSDGMHELQTYICNMMLHDLIGYIIYYILYMHIYYI